MDVVFPYRAVRMKSVARPIGRGRLGGRSISSHDRPIPTASGHWQVQAQFMVPYSGRGQWNAFLAQMQGILGVVEIPVFKSPRMKTTDGRRIEFKSPVAGVDGNDTFQYFGFSRDTGDWVILLAAAALRSTTLRISVDYQVIGLRPGNQFSIEGRLYEVVTHHVDPETGEDVIHIWPPLRQAAVVGQKLEITYPTCRVRFADEGAGYPADESLPMWVCSANFVEVV